VLRLYYGTTCTSKHNLSPGTITRALELDLVDLTRHRQMKTQQSNKLNELLQGQIMTLVRTYLGLVEPSKLADHIVYRSP